MLTISLRNDYGVRDAGDPLELNPALEQINLTGEYEVTFDLKKCLLDYPESSAIIDKVLTSWKGSSEKKRLKIILDFQLKINTILSWLFIGSKCINTTRDTPTEEIENKIKQYMSKINATFELKIEPVNGKNTEYCL